MSQLESPERAEGERVDDPATETGRSTSDGSTAESTSLTVGESGRPVTLPADATRDEAAAVAAAIGAHLSDRQRAAAVAATATDTPDHVDGWRFASKLRSLGKRRWDSPVASGEEWKAASRAFPR